MMNKWYCLALAIVLLFDTTNSSLFRKRFFRNGKLWVKNDKSTKSEGITLEQKLDHFNPDDDRTWKQKYFASEAFSKGKRDVAFLNIGGEEELSEMSIGAWQDYAKKHEAILFELEHRYYGDSRPTENLTTESLKYLSSRQALADIAHFIQTINKQYQLDPDVKWIVFGGSYAGSLAAWARQQYPELIHGAVSSSGPLLAKLDFYEYLQVVADSFRASNETCLTVLQEAYKQLEELLNDAENRHKINKIFRLCQNIEDRIDNPLDISTLFERLSSYISLVIQYSIPNSTMSADFMCGFLLDESKGAEIDRLGTLIIYLETVNYDGCLSIDYQDLVSCCQDEDWDSNEIGIRQWYYQTCTEFGFYLTTSVEPYTFGRHLDVDFYVQQCKDMYSPVFDKPFLENAIAKTNDLYHGLDIQINNTVFVHGSVDPWHALGITKTRYEDAPAILIEGASHCSDMSFPSEFDTPQVTEARKHIDKLISQWLNN